MFLDPRLESQSSFITSLKLCQVRLHHNSAFPWILLIPQIKDTVEILDLSSSNQLLLMEEVAFASQVMENLFRPKKLNIANLGNVVPQFHVHIIARYDDDGAWPGPVWNSGIDGVYDSKAKIDRITQLKEAFLSPPPSSFPLSLLREANVLFQEAAEEGFDWDSPFQAASKVKEELAEVLEELDKTDSPQCSEALKDEVGDLFLAAVCLARHCNVDPEEAMEKGLTKFKTRYEHMKSYAQDRGIFLKDLSSGDLQILWKESKKKSKI